LAQGCFRECHLGMTYASKFRFCGGVVLATLLATFLAAAIASPVSLFGRPATQRRLVELQTPRLPSASAIRAGAVDKLFSDRDPAAGRFCNSCVQIGSQGISILLNEILNAGVIGGCGKLCGALPKGVERKGCDLACSVVGIKAFISVLKRADIDPIYLCEELKACPAGRDDAAGSVRGTAVSPAAGPAGTTFAMELDFSILNATGVGEIRIAVDGAQHVGQSFLNTGFAPGEFSTNVSLSTKDDESADPPVIWSPGKYTYTFEVCQGECGSKHPHSKVLGTTKGTFEIQ